MKQLCYISVCLSAFLITASFAALPTSGLHFHYRADSLNLSDGDPVTNWSDSDSNLNNITLYPQAGKLVPTFVENAICGKPAVRFVTPDPADPNSRTVLESTATWGNWGGNGVCVFIVCTGGEDDRQQRLLQLGRIGKVVNNYKSIIADVSAYRGGNWFNNGEVRKRSPFKKGEWIISIHEAPKNVNVFDSFYAVNNTNALQIDSFSTPGNFSPYNTGNSTLMGGITDKDGYWTPGYNGDVAEVIIYNRTLSTAEKQSVIDYLNEKYFLPAAHNPSPAKCSADTGSLTGNQKAVTFSWNTGLSPDFINVNPAITHHHLYIVADEPDFTGVAPITIPAAGLLTGTYGPILLNMNKTYYWRVDEGVVSPTAPQTITGPIWSFNTGYHDANPMSLAADPDILLVDDTFYVYPTSGTARQFYVWSTANLADWVVHGPILDFNNVSWIPSTGANAWAPGMIERNGIYYMYFSVGPYPSKIGVAYSSSPMGPFTDSGAPLLVDDGSYTFESIDAMAFKDPVSGNYYLYAGGSAGDKLRMWRLNDDMLNFAEEIIVDTPPYFTEGAFMHYRDGIYYMSYSNGSWRYEDNTYCVHYATSSSPAGPWTYRGKILQGNDVYKSPGHHSIYYNGRTDEWYIVYHRWDPLDLSRRSAAIDRLYYLPDGRLQPIVMTERGIGPIPLGKWLASDFNEDGSVGLPDLNDFCNAWLTADVMSDIVPVNGDGFVDLQDFELFSSQWGR